MSTWYQCTPKYASPTPKIFPVEVVASSAHFVTLASGRRRAIRSDYESFYPTWAAARDALYEAAKWRSEVALSEVDAEIRCMKAIEKLAEPTP